MENSVLCLQLQYSLLFTLKTQWNITNRMGSVCRVTDSQPTVQRMIILQMNLFHILNYTPAVIYPQFVLQQVYLMRKYLVPVNKKRHFYLKEK